MKNLLLVAVAGLVLLVLAGTGMLLLSHSEDAPLARSGQSEGVEDGNGTAGGDEMQSALGGALDGVDGKGDDGQAEAREAIAASADQDVVVLRGRTLAPFGSPRDDSLTVYALPKEAEYDGFIQRLLGATAERRERLVLSESIVKSDGTWELELPADHKRAWVIAVGQFLYSPETVDLSIGGEEANELHLRLGAYVHGTLSAAGSDTLALVGVRVLLDLDTTALDGKPDNRETLTLEIESDARGQFELRAIPTRYAYKLGVIPDHYAAQSLSLNALKPGEKRELEIALDEGGSITGVVLDPAGKGIEGSVVNALLIGASFGFDDKEVGNAITNVDGKFELTNMPVGKMALKANHHNFLESKRVNVEVLAGETTPGIKIALTEGRSLAGIVRWPDGSPAANATVLVQFDQAYMAGLSAFNSLRGANAETLTGEDGRFVVNGLGSGPFVVGSRARPLDLEPDPEEERHDYSRWFRARAESVQPGSDIELELHGPVGIRGRVIDDKKNPVASFQLHAIRRSKGSFGPVGMEDRKEKFENEDGSFFLADVNDGTWELSVLGETYVSLEPVPVSVPSDTPVVVQLVRSASIAGRVLTASGTPVSGATISVAGGEVAFQEAMRTVDGRPTVRSDETGYFVFEHLAPSSLALQAKHDDYCESEAQPFELSPGVKIDDAELRLRSGGMLTGLAYDKAGKLAAGYLVVLSTTDLRQIFSTTNSNGEFKVEHVPPGSWSVVVMNSQADLSADSDGGYAGAMSSMSMSQADILEGETTHLVIGAPPADPVKLTGKVTHDDEPYLGASLIFFRQGTKMYANMKFATFDEDGTYSVVVDGPGAYIVYLQKMGRTQIQQQNVEYSIDVPMVEEHVHDFEVPLGRISGRITNSSGEPAVDARVTIATDGGFRSDVLMGGQYSEVQTNASGHYDLVGLRPGTYMIAAGGAMLLDVSGSSGSQVGRVTRGGIRLGENEWKQDFDFELPAPGAIEVTVVGIDGQPLKEASVFLRDSSGRPVEPFSFTSTQATGVCLIRGLAPGDYSVVARKALASSQESEPIRVTTGATTKLSLRLEEGTILWIKLKDEEGEDVRASVSVVDSDTGRDWAAFFGMEDLQVLYLDGEFSPTEQRLGPLPPGKYRIVATGLTGSKSKPVTLRGEPERKVVMRLK